MCGPAGSGKSTWISGDAEAGTSAVISRDKIRFSMVSEDESYFSKEKEVYAEFCKQIAQAIDAPWVETVYADATHLTRKARQQLLDNVLPQTKTPIENIKIIPIVIYPQLETILERNARRSGRARVPDTVIKNMYNDFQLPEYNEKYK